MSAKPTNAATTATFSPTILISKKFTLEKKTEYCLQEKHYAPIHKSLESKCEFEFKLYSNVDISKYISLSGETSRVTVPSGVEEVTVSTNGSFAGIIGFEGLSIEFKYACGAARILGDYKIIKNSGIQILYKNTFTELRAIGSNFTMALSANNENGKEIKIVTFKVGENSLALSDDNELPPGFEEVLNNQSGREIVGDNIKMEEPD